MTDIERAKTELINYTLCLAADEKLITSTKRGIAPLIDCIESGADFSGFSAADRIVGKAAALLYVYMKIKEVYAEVLSKSAEKVFIEYGVKYSHGVITEKIINRAGDGICPMEQAVADILSPEEALSTIQNKLAELKSRN